MSRMIAQICLVAAAVIVGIAGVHARQPHVQSSATVAPAAAVDRALIDKYCVTCHNERRKTAGLALDGINFTQVRANVDVLEKVVAKLRSGQMPAPGAPRPDKATLEPFVTALETALDQAAAASPNAGRVAVRRLNKVEYLNAIHDLLDLDIDSDLLPADSPGVGFDNNSDSLSMTPAVMNRYMSAATKVTRLALGDPANRLEVSEYKAPQFQDPDIQLRVEDLPFGTRGGLVASHNFPLDGEYAFKVRLQRNTYGNTIRGLEDPVEIQLRIDRKLVKTFTIGGEHRGFDPAVHLAVAEDDAVHQLRHKYRLTADNNLEFRMPVQAGPRSVSVAFTDRTPMIPERVPNRATSLKASRYQDDFTDPGVDTLQIVGPYSGKVPKDTPSRRRILVCRPAGDAQVEPCARQIIGGVARRAFRQPVGEADLRGLMRLFRVGHKDGGFEAGIGLALETILASPDFLFRIEREPAGVAPGTVYRVSDLELASRLSFALWKSLPDDELLQVAIDGKLRNRDVRMKQVRRMLADPRAMRWIDDFMAQWLGVRNLQEHEPDTRFEHFTDSLREAMYSETKLFFESQVREDKSVLDLLRANYTYLNSELAAFYDVPNVYGSHFRRVEITNPNRQGLLGHASIHTVTSYADRTSVVLRGKWALSTLLDAPPPPPPPNVPALPENKHGAAPKTLRERMEQHRKNAVCSSCHAPMDPLGFALENFDATGHWRDTEDGLRIDASTKTPQGATIDGPVGFRNHLLSRSDELVRTVSSKLLEYFLGRTLHAYDRPAVRAIMREAGADARWSAIALGIVESVPFQMKTVVGRDAVPVSATVAERR